MDSKKDERINRREFVAVSVAGAGLLAAGAAAGWWARRSRVRSGAAELTSSFVYDVSQYQQTDPKLLLFDETAQIPTGLIDSRRIAAGANGQILVAGDRVVKVFDRLGQPLRTIPLDEAPFALHVTHDGRVLVGLKNRIETYDDEGKLMARGDVLGDRTYITSIAAAGEAMFVADAGNREVVRCDRNGKAVMRFGKRKLARGGEGFIVPSPYFDLQAGADGLLRVANTGRHRIETYTLDGKLDQAWGSASMAMEGFCGCCNPSYFTLLPDGRFVTSEKGLNRIKVYDRQGNFQGVVAGPEHLVRDAEMARRACHDCRIGFAFDVASDSQGRVLALDPCTQSVRVFTAQEQGIKERAQGAAARTDGTYRT